MTRINLVPVFELSDQHLIAEYHELPRCIKQNINIDKEVPSKYKLGKGHMKWAKMHSLYLIYRFKELIQEMEYRGFNHQYDLLSLQQYWLLKQHLIGNSWYVPTEEDLILNRSRLVEKYLLKPSFYTWTRREKPYYYITH